MTTVKYLKKWLDQFPEETVVRVAVQEEAGNYDSYGPVNFVPPTLSSLKESDAGYGWEFIDLRNNKFLKEGAPNFGKCFLNIGEKR